MPKPSKFQRVGSFKVTSSRAGYGPVILSLGGKFELQMVYKTGRQELEFFKNHHSKSIWGYITNIDVISDKSINTGEMSEYFRISNEDGEILDFKVKGFDPIINKF